MAERATSGGLAAEMPAQRRQLGPGPMWAGLASARFMAAMDKAHCYADVRPEAEAPGRLLAEKVLCGGSDSVTPKLPLRMV